MDPVRVLIVGSDPLNRASLHEALSNRQELKVVGTADLEPGLSAVVEAFQPEVLIVDATWEAESTNSPLELLSEIDQPTVLLSDGPLERSGKGFSWLSSGSHPDQISAAVMAASNGLIVYDQQTYSTSRLEEDHDDDELFEPLTPRELEVLQLMAEGLTNRGIAFQLGISEYTVKFHVTAILGKLQAQSRTEASIKAARMGLIMI